jgi:hypothetical protein
MMLVWYHWQVARTAPWWLARCVCEWWWFRTCDSIPSLGGEGVGALGGGGGGALAAGLVRKRKDVRRTVAVSPQRQPPALCWAHCCYLLPTTQGAHGAGEGAPRMANTSQVWCGRRSVCVTFCGSKHRKPCVERTSGTNAK